MPYRKTDPDTGKSALMDPPYEVRVAQIALGDNYAVLRAGTVNGARGAARHVWAVWNAQGLDLTERQAADPKSAHRADGVEAVARQIASDLQRFFRRRIADWHQGPHEQLRAAGTVRHLHRRRPRREGPHDPGRLRPRARRAGRRDARRELPEWQQMLRQSTNTLAVLRAAQVPGAQADEYGERLFFPLAKIAEIDAEEQRRQAEEKRMRESGADDSMAAMWTQTDDDEEENS